MSPHPAGTRRLAAVVAGVAACLVLGGGPAAACSPVEHVLLDDVVADGRTGGRVLEYVGAAERRVVAHAPRVPVLTTRRSVWIGSRTWGDVGELTPPDRRQGAYFGAVFDVIGFCPDLPQPRTGDVVMTAVAERSDGSRVAVPMEREPYRFDPTFAGGLTADQEALLAARFGQADMLPAPSPTRLALARLWSWSPGLALYGSVTLVVIASVRRSRRRIRDEAT